MMNIKDLGVAPAKILLPRADLDIQKWAVVACDQYTSEPEYWETAKNFVGEAPSTLNIIFPEVYLEQDEDSKATRIEKINATMNQYLTAGILTETPSSLIYLNRSTKKHPTRQGLVLAVDLEKYDYTIGSQTLIRATEGTVLDRIPPRLKIRAHAPIELPHIMLLIDDPEQTIIEPIAKKLSELKKVYDFDLMFESGHLTGYQIEQTEIIEQIFENLSQLVLPEKYTAKYGLASGENPLLFATGDGNHSLATAKAHWENIKKTLTTEQQEKHPARFALAEVVNIHDAGLEFEPIHRVIFNTDLEEILTAVNKYAVINRLILQTEHFDSRAAADIAAKEYMTANPLGTSQIIPLQAGNSWALVHFPQPKYQLTVGTWQDFLDWWIKENPNIKIDYVHDDASVDKLSQIEKNVGCYLPAMHKNELFKTVIKDGALPRKTFSMGSSDEKRFYFEARKIQ